MSALAYLVTVALAHVATNFDNLAMVVILTPLQGLNRTVAAYAVSQIIIAGFAIVFAVGVFSIVGGWIGLLGLFPIALGLYALFSGTGDDLAAPDRANAGFAGMVLMFLILGVDTFSLMAPVLGDTASAYFPVALLGMALSVMGLCIASALLVRTAERSAALTQRLARIAPFVMIAAGLYVLLDTPTDVV